MKMKYFEISGNPHNTNPYVDLIKEFPRTMKRKRALELSILKWETIVNYLKINKDEVIYNDSDTCALCTLYVGCLRCPVALAVREEGCYGTPWKELANLYDAQAELGFLKEIWNNLYS